MDQRPEASLDMWKHRPDEEWDWDNPGQRAQ